MKRKKRTPAKTTHTDWMLSEINARIKVRGGNDDVSLVELQMVLEAVIADLSAKGKR